MERTGQKTKNSAARTTSHGAHATRQTSGRTPLDRADAICGQSVLATGEGRRTASASCVRSRWSGRLNKSSEDLLTLDILRWRELRLEARHLRRSSAAWAALAQ